MTLTMLLINYEKHRDGNDDESELLLRWVRVVEQSGTDSIDLFQCPRKILYPRRSVDTYCVDSSRNSMETLRGGGFITPPKT